VRIDLFLKLARLCSRRAVAQQLCDAGQVLLNGHVAKPARAVTAGDEISIRRGEHQLTVKIAAVPAGRQVSRQQSHELYTIVSERNISLESTSSESISSEFRL
jgi:ribosomal 50S subunit-recycling heat shock protein